LSHSWKLQCVKIGYGHAKTRYEQKKQFVEPTGKKEIIFYESFSTSVDDSVEEMVALASTLGLTCTADILEEDEYFYGNASTNWCKQYYEVSGEEKFF
jgi:hypothetical protein